MPRKKNQVQTLSLAPRQRWLLLTVEVLGLAIAVYLTLIAFHVLYGGEVPCLRSKIFACESVVRGQFSKIGPVSIAVMGVLYFVGQIGLTALVGRRSWTSWLKAAAVLTGLLFVAWLRALELVHMKKICPWCWGVALTVVLQTALIWPLAAPVLPRMGFFGRLAGATIFLFAFLGLTAGVEEIFKPSRAGTVYFFGWKPAKEDEEDADAGTETELEESRPPATQMASASRTKPKPTPRPAPAKTPAPESDPEAVVLDEPTPPPASAPELATARPQFVSSTPPPAPTPKPTPRPAPDIGPEPPIDLPEVPELQILQQRGWRMVASTERVEQLIPALGPVLLMVFDPFCEDCHATIRKGLNAPEVDGLPVTRVAIEQSSLTGKISDQVTHVPTLLLIDREGIVRYKHEGQIKSAKLVKDINALVGP